MLYTIHMNTTNVLIQNPALLLTIAVWDLVWKGLALWRSAEKRQRYWFIALLVVNSIGLVPIIYLLIDRYYKPKLVKL